MEIYGRNAGEKNLWVSPSIGQRMVVEKKPGRNIKCDKNIDGIMFVGGKNEEDSKQVGHPSCSMKRIPTRGRVLCKRAVRKNKNIMEKPSDGSQTKDS